jgi:hypothetical protein
MRKGTIILSLAALLLGGCYKDELRPEELTYNPFDRDYDGPPVFVLEGTFLETTTYPPPLGTITEQVIEFRVRNELFVQEPGSYRVWVRDQQNGVTIAEGMLPVVPGGHTFKYRRAQAPGVEICLELRLLNSLSTARPETICATL